MPDDFRHSTNPTDLYRRLWADDPTSSVLAALLAQSLHEQGAYAEALTTADSAIALDCHNLAPRLTRAHTMRALGRLDEAALGYAAIVESHPAPAGILITLALIHIARARLDQAIETLHLAIRHAPNSADAYALLGATHARLNAPQPAIAACRAALAHDPNHITAHQNLAALLARSAPETAHTHEKRAYRQRQIFTTPALPGAPTGLILTCAAAASIPLEHLLPPSRYGQIQWFIDYATPDQDQRLPAHDFIFNAIGDPDLMPDPTSIRPLLASTTRPVFNHPDRIARTTRANLPDLLTGIPDIVVPPVSRITLRSRDWHHRHTLPIIMRPTGSHGGTNLQLFTSATAAETALRHHADAYITDFIDYRSESDRLYRKYRVIFVAGQAYPYHLAIGADWLLHYVTAGMTTAPSRRAEEARFLSNPTDALGSAAMAALAKIAVRLDLDYAGIDFSLLPDGRLLVFEANATMLVHPERDVMFAYKNRAVQSILTAFTSMIETRLNPPSRTRLTRPAVPQ